MGAVTEHKWTVGDLCETSYGGIGHGMIYRVAAISSRGNGSVSVLKIVPIVGVLTDIEGRKPRSMGAGWCRPVTLVYLANEYAKFGEFIAEEARRRGA